ncbi:MAG: signal peptidase I [Candidatus Polarisedimenticolaceae bacterium]|nr:signal peptidase I [Candidatus Polarisedimenticolaceae bacterium]
MLNSLRTLADQINESGTIKSRSPLLALLISVFPGLGQHYAGFILRGIVLYVALIIISWLAAVAFMSVDSRLSTLFLAIPMLSAILIALDAWACAAKQESNYRLKWFNQAWIYIAVTLFLMVTINPAMDLLVGKHVVRAYYIDNDSMSPTVLNHDILLINHLTTPGRGDLAIINFSQTEKPSGLTKVMDGQLIRRVIAVAGDRVEIKGQKLYINDLPLDEPYIGHDNRFQPTTFGNNNLDMAAIEVPDNAVYILADNRSAGLDSRVLGTINSDLIDGKVTKVFWSWNLDEGHFQWNRTALGL